MNEGLDWADRAAPSLEAFAALARPPSAALPHEVRQLTGDVVFRVQDFAEPERVGGSGPGRSL